MSGRINALPRDGMTRSDGQCIGRRGRLLVPGGRGYPRGYLAESGESQGEAHAVPSSMDPASPRNYPWVSSDSQIEALDFIFFRVSPPGTSIFRISCLRTAADEPRARTNRISRSPGPSESAGPEWHWCHPAVPMSWGRGGRRPERVPGGEVPPACRGSHPMWCRTSARSRRSAPPPRKLGCRDRGHTGPPTG